MVIGGLSVKCPCYVNGCEWIGELSNLSLHESKCEHKVNTEPQKVAQDPCWKSLLREMTERMDKYESSLECKDKDIAHLKFSLEETKTEMGAKIKKLQDEVKMLKTNQTQEVKQMELKVENLGLKNTFLEQKVETLEGRLKDAETEIVACKAGNEKLHNEMDGLKDELSVLPTMDLLKTDIEGVKASQVKMKTELKNMISSNVQTEITKLRTSVNASSNKIHDKINKLNSRVDGFEKNNLFKSSNKMLESRVTELDSRIDELVEDMDSKASSQSLDSCVTALKKSLTNLENISFCDYSGGSKDIKLVWKLENYQHLADIGKDVFSPIFGTRLDGHCFQLWVDWNASGDFGLYLKLHRPESSDKEKILDSFAVPFNLEVMGNAGTPSVIKTVPLEVINAHREKFFTIKAYDDRADSVLGWSKLVLKKDIHRYIVNDSLTLVCRLKPS